MNNGTVFVHPTLGTWNPQAPTLGYRFEQGPWHAFPPCYPWQCWVPWAYSRQISSDRTGTSSFSGCLEVSLRVAYTVDEGTRKSLKLDRTFWTCHCHPQSPQKVCPQGFPTWEATLERPLISLWMRRSTCSNLSYKRSKHLYHLGQC